MDNLGDEKKISRSGFKSTVEYLTVLDRLCKATREPLGGFDKREQTARDPPIVSQESAFEYVTHGIHLRICGISARFVRAGRKEERKK